MRALLLTAAACAALLGCAPPAAKQAQAPAAPPTLSCDQSQSFPVDFSTPGAKDTVTVRTIAAPALTELAQAEDMNNGGALCGQATALFTVHSGGNGGLMYSFTTQLGFMDFHSGPEPGGWTPENTANFLKGWAESATLTKTDQAPKLNAKDVRLTTSLTPAAYAEIVNQARPMLCLNTSIHDLSCSYSDLDRAGLFTPFYVLDQS
jgi:hypothetical protein